MSTEVDGGSLAPLLLNIVKRSRAFGEWSWSTPRSQPSSAVLCAAGGRSKRGDSRREADEDATSKEIGRSDSSPRVRSARSVPYRIKVAGACRDCRRSNEALLAAGAEEHERRPISRHAEPATGRAQDGAAALACGARRRQRGEPPVIGFRTHVDRRDPQECAGIARRGAPDYSVER